MFRQRERGLFEEFPEGEHQLNNLQIQANSQPFLLDINGDMITDFMFVTAGTPTVPPEIMVAVGVDTRGEKFRLEPFSNFLISSREDNRCKDPNPADMISTPHSNSFVDLDGDCMPDIFLQKTRITESTFATYYQTYFEIYTQKVINNKLRFCLIQTNAFLNDQPATNTQRSDSVPLVQFVDINRDSMTDLVFYDDKNIFVYYNKHTPPEFSSSFDTEFLCREWTTTQFTPVFTDFNMLKFGKDPDMTVQLLDSQFEHPIIDIANPLVNQPKFPTRGRLRISDLNIDGFPDILLTL